MTPDVKAANTSDTSACASVRARRRRHTRVCVCVFFAAQSHLGLHELGVVLVDLHLFDLLFTVLGVQQAVGFQHLDLILQVSNVALQRGNFGVLRTKMQSRHTSTAARARPQVACCQITLEREDAGEKKWKKKPG